MTGRELVLYILENGLEEEEVIDANGNPAGMMSPEEAAEKFEVSVSTVMAWLATGKIESFYISGTVSCACILCSHHISTKRTAALATCYELAQSNLMDYQAKVREKLGEKKEAEIRHEINEEKIKNEPVPEEYRNELAYTDGMTVFKDRYGRFFRSNMEIIRKAEKTISDRLNTEMYISLNEFYYELGIGSTDGGADLYFTVEKGIDVVTDPVKNTDGNTITYLTWMNPPEEIFSQGSTSVYKY